MRRRAELRFPGLRVEERPPEGDGRFSLRILRPGAAGIRWEMIPDQNAEAPFLGLLEGLQTPPARSPLARLSPLPPVTLYAARWCSASSGVLGLLAALAAAEPRLSLRVIDAEELLPAERPPALASVPWTVLGEGEGRIFGAFTEEDFRGAVQAHIQGEASLWTLRNLLSRRLDDEARELIHAGLLRSEDLGRLVLSPDLGVRLAAIHFLSKASSDAALDLRAAGDVLAGVLREGEPRDRGDAAYALGEMGDPRFLAALEALRGDPDEEVREAAEEAREKILGASGGTLTG